VSAELEQILANTTWFYCGACGDPTAWQYINATHHVWICQVCGAKTEVRRG
jgi:rubrerythrin